MYRNHDYEILCDLQNIHETGLAVLFRDEEGEEFWIPKSVLRGYPDEGKTGDAMVQIWFAEQEGLI